MVHCKLATYGMKGLRFPHRATRISVTYAKDPLWTLPSVVDTCPRGWWVFIHADTSDGLAYVLQRCRSHKWSHLFAEQLDNNLAQADVVTYDPVYEGLMAQNSGRNRVNIYVSESYKCLFRKKINTNFCETRQCFLQRHLTANILKLHNFTRHDQHRQI